MVRVHEHAAINPMGVKCVIAKSIARIHKGNLVNHGIIPMILRILQIMTEFPRGMI